MSSSQRHEYLWTAQSQPRALVVLVHGFCEHAGRHAGLAQRLNAANIAVAAADLRGHGRSPGARIWIDRFSDYLDDAEQELAGARVRFPDCPVFLLGFSMGALIALHLALYRRVDVRGLVLAAPGVVIDDGVAPLLRRIAPLASRFLPWLRLVKVNPKYLSRDPQVVAGFNADPDCFHGRFPVRTGAEILAASRLVIQDLPRLQTPLLVLHGAADRLTAPRGSQLVYQQAASTDKTLHLYPDLYHDLFHEPQSQRVYDDLLAWLAARCSPSDPRK